jgi:hypothetical protein
MNLPSNQNFGYFFSIIFIILFFYFYFNFNFNSFFSYFFLTFSILTLSLTYYFPRVLKPFNKIWFLFGLFLGKITSPIILGFLFFLIISPISLITRLFGRDILLIKKNNKTSYWIKSEKTQYHNSKSGFKNQF